MHAEDSRNLRAMLCPVSEFDRFWEKINPAGALIVPELGPCWDWEGSVSRGYGVISIRAHRLAYDLLRGEIPPELVLDHLCRNTTCVNPGHLEPVTRGENVRRGEAAETSYNAKKTHCKRGHPFSLENTDVFRGQRQCRTCKREYKRRVRAGRR